MTELEIKEKLCNKLISIWAIQDALLQAYRSIYITSISILFAFASALLVLPLDTKIGNLYPMLYFDIPIGIVGLFIVYQWMKVTDKRGHDVTFIQNQLMYCEKKSQIAVITVDINHQEQFSFIETNREIEFSVVTTFKNFENMNANKQKEILGNFNINGILISKETIDITTRTTLQRWFPYFWGILWLCLLILSIFRIFG